MVENNDGGGKGGGVDGNGNDCSDYKNDNGDDVACSGDETENSVNVSFDDEDDNEQAMLMMVMKRTMCECYYTEYRLSRWL